MNDFIDEATDGRFEVGLNVSVETTDQVFPPIPDRALDKMQSIDLHFKGETKFSKADFDRLRAAIYRDVIYLKETNPGQFHIVDGHGTIGQAMSDKKTILPVWFEKRNGTVEKFNLNLTTYQLEPING